MTNTVTLNKIKCNVNKLNYSRNNQIALQLIAAESQTIELGDDKVDTVFAGEPICIATVALPDAELATDETVIKTYENPNVLNTLLEAGLIKMTERSVQVGYAECPIVQVTM